MYERNNQKKRYVIALRYQGEQEDRYLVHRVAAVKSLPTHGLLYFVLSSFENFIK